MPKRKRSHVAVSDGAVAARRQGKIRDNVSLGVLPPEIVGYIVGALDEASDVASCRSASRIFCVHTLAQLAARWRLGHVAEFMLSDAPSTMICDVLAHWNRGMITHALTASHCDRFDIVRWAMERAEERVKRNATCNQKVDRVCRPCLCCGMGPLCTDVPTCEACPVCSNDTDVETVLPRLRKEEARSWILSKILVNAAHRDQHDLVRWLLCETSMLAPPLCLDLDSVLEGAARGGALATVRALTACLQERLACTTWQTEAAAKALDVAVAHGHVDVVAYLHDLTYRETQCACGEPLGDTAFLRGHAAVVEWLDGAACRRRYVCTVDSLSAAVDTGSTALVRWVLARSADWQRRVPARVLRNAAAEGRTDMVVLLHESGVKSCSVHALIEAVKGDHISLLRWAAGENLDGGDADDTLAVSFTVPTAMTATAPVPGWCTQEVALAAASAGSTLVVSWLLRHPKGARLFDGRVARAAVRSGHPELAIMMHDAGVVPMSSWDALEHAVANASLESICAIGARDAIYGRRVLAKAVKRGRTNVLPYLCERYSVDRTDIVCTAREVTCWAMGTWVGRNRRPSALNATGAAFKGIHWLCANGADMAGDVMSIVDRFIAAAAPATDSARIATIIKSLLGA